MNRFMQFFNLLGILILAGLCGFQWHVNGRLNREIIRLTEIEREQSTQLQKRDQTIREDAADLDDFRRRLIISEDALKESQDKFAAAAAEPGRLKIQCDQLNAAVTARDAALKQADEGLVKMIAQRDDAVAKFNDLAVKYNAIVKESNDQNKK
jgi:septal ring factor EnvC (AmiA/AmiB activator)